MARHREPVKCRAGVSDWFAPTVVRKVVFACNVYFMCDMLCAIYFSNIFSIQYYSFQIYYLACNILWTWNIFSLVWRNDKYSCNGFIFPLNANQLAHPHKCLVVWMGDCDWLLQQLHDK